SPSALLPAHAAEAEYPRARRADEPSRLGKHQRAEHRAAEVRRDDPARHARPGSARRGWHPRLAIRRRRTRRRLQGNVRGTVGDRHAITETSHDSIDVFKLSI